VKEMYVRDGINGDKIEVLPVGCDTDTFKPYSKDDPKIIAVREALGIAPDELMILTVGGDAASKGGREVMQALAIIDKKVPKWKYVCKVWPQKRTSIQDASDEELAESLGIEKKVIYAVNTISRNFMPYLIGACDIYAAPSRLEGFGMPQVEAGACGKPVLSINAMGMLDTLVHGETALLAGVAQKIVVNEVILGAASGFEEGHKVVFDTPRIVDYRADVPDIAKYMELLMNDASLRDKLGKAGHERVVANFDYRVVAKKFVQIMNDKLGIQ
jgi:glycosyltransferase involved in cell wall biosynthesis